MDLPSSGRPVALVLQIRHFRCPNRACPRKTFAEPLPHLLLPRAQRTSRLRESLRELGEEGGGQAGARMSKQQGMACSASTVLRLLRHSSLPASPPVKVLGVDDWAWRKGQSYGTILVDLERHVPVDLLPDASADSFATWLKEHPSVELISRDRGTTKALGATRGAPQALQIADRLGIWAHYPQFGRGIGESPGAAPYRFETCAHSIRRRAPGDRSIGPTGPCPCHGPFSS